MSKLLKCTNNDIRDIFPRIKNLGASSFGEDADIFGDTLAEVIENAPQGHDLLFKQQTINELKNLLACNDAEIDHASYALIAISPTEEVEEPPNWGSFPTLRAFWSAILDAFANDPEVQAGREIDPDM
ncbi:MULTISPECIES: hypothetical protein [Acetobacter]|jgi:hypothetical protein|uniref:CdiI immunity protein domain-containing protein n=1 Tax=Acetobacter lovaniensis TaxID=104100 RepID=A0A841QI67_9PROT|nr:hypothetical protein [Acetobacter lovaniensis]MBB6457924.1 hypothetical protein [Acetobacter lovaniensis]MCI1697789.1 hypothetical protein [Acetobacter lovaniensis]MCI1795814.1 hypothetical protein [Acetobacter lovaniensis]MCP1239449.1 hypothetical protein [Acetobacter lovaniensis]GBQ66148.1 hypothetical protein AA0474_1033 [Acetobacter lovaniensis NRIC 0474]